MAEAGLHPGPGGAWQQRCCWRRRRPPLTCRLLCPQPADAEREAAETQCCCGLCLCMEMRFISAKTEGLRRPPAGAPFVSIIAFSGCFGVFSLSKCWRFSSADVSCLIKSVAAGNKCFRSHETLRFFFFCFSAFLEVKPHFKLKLKSLDGSCHDSEFLELIVRKNNCD